MAPLDPELSEVVISDKQWLIENALCLLSNAVKYSSEGGAVRLTTELVRMKTIGEGSEGVREGRDRRDGRGSEVEITPVGNRQWDTQTTSEQGTPSKPEEAKEEGKEAGKEEGKQCPSVNFSHETLVQAMTQVRLLTLITHEYAGKDNRTRHNCYD